MRVFFSGGHAKAFLFLDEKYNFKKKARVATQFANVGWVGKIKAFLSTKQRIMRT